MMKLRAANRKTRETRAAREAGSLLIIVLWIGFGLVALALYFATSMTSELRTADNRVAILEAQQAIAGATRFVSNVLITAQYPGLAPYMETYDCEAVPVGDSPTLEEDARFWFIGRDPSQLQRDQPYFYLVDESSKLNLNADWVTTDNGYGSVLMYVPRMTADLAANIPAWRGAVSTSSTSLTGGATDETYIQLNPAYHLKGANFESVDELRLVFGATTDILYGEDLNQNGILDPNEPEDIPNGLLDPGILDYLTVYSKDSILGIDVTNKISVSDSANLQTLMEQMLGAPRADEILQQLNIPLSGGAAAPGAGPPTATAPTFTNLLDFYIQANTLANMTPDEFALIEGDITCTNAYPCPVNVNTASGPVLAAILGSLGISTDYAGEIVAYREANPTRLNTMAWIVDAIGQDNARALGPYVTGHSYQWTADIAAVGHHGRGYQRAKFVFDMSEGTPRIVYQQDLTHLGWALGTDVRRNLQLGSQTR